MDYSQAWTQIERAIFMFAQHSRNFGDVKVAANEFAEIVK